MTRQKSNDDVADSEHTARMTAAEVGVRVPTASMEAVKDHALITRFSIRVLSGVDDGKVTTSSNSRIVVGTSESADLKLTDPFVSGFHFEISLRDGWPMLRDLESRNGTRVDGVDVIQGRPRSGATITIGETQLRFEVGEDKARIPLSVSESFGVMNGRSPVMREVFALLERAAASDATVLLEGETGTGKEAAAESIHRESGRRNGPFVVVDCGAIPADLLESELFGHERGAFTGAVAARVGAFEAANGGTIFLDEVGELNGDLQPKLLRVLERRQIKRVGQSLYQPVDVRVIAATNRNLRSEVNHHRFRSDLYYRLAVIEARLPPLRERPEDIPLLVPDLLRAMGVDKSPESELLCSREFFDDLYRHSWPGNVRELRNYLERCLALHQRSPFESDGAAEQQPRIDADKPLRVAREAWTRVFERRYLDEVLRRSENNVTAAARAAGVDRIYFYRLLWRHGIR